MKTIFFECNMGAAGDMLMGALYEICEQKQLFLETMNRVFSPFGVTVNAEPSVKCGITGTHMTVRIHDAEEGGSRPAGAPIPGAHTHDAADTAAPGSHTHDAADTAAPGTHTHDKTDNTAPDAHTHGQADAAAPGAHIHDKTDKSAPDAHTHGQADAAAPGSHVHHHTDYQAILTEIDSLPLPEKVRADAASIYRLLGEAEAKVHGTELSQIHFHEVGTLDALADVVGCAYLFYLIAPDEILSSPVHVGNGFVQCAHGILPVPAPATAELLRQIPCYTGAITGELCTPTGAALLKYYAARFFSMPPITIHSIGYGMGKKDFPAANCVRVFLGEAFHEEPPVWKDISGQTAKKAPAPSTDAADPEDDFDEPFPCDDSVLSISCNIDDMTGEALGLATEILMAAGALDVYTIPVQMKKNRPGILLTCICKPEERDKFTGLFFLHTSTRGVRYQLSDRAKLESTIETRRTAYGDIRVKKSSGYGIEKEKPEFEDLKSVVLKNKCSLSLTEVAESIR